MSEPQTLVLDANILIDVLVFKKKAENRPSVELLTRIAQGKFKAIIPAPVLLEVYNKVLQYTHSAGKAEESLRFMLNAVNTEFSPISLDHSLVACEFFRDINYTCNSGHFEIKPDTEPTLSTVDGLILSVGMTEGQMICSRDKLFKDANGVITKRPDEL